MLSASHIPGQQNLVADFLSRGKFLPSEWSLHPSVFLQILRVYPPLSVDLFASSLAHLLPCYCARADDSDAWALDAFFQSLVGLPRDCIPSVCSPSESSREGSVRSGIPPSSRSFLAQEALGFLGSCRFSPVSRGPFRFFPGLLRQPVSLIQHPNPRVTSSYSLARSPLSRAWGQASLSGLPTSQPYISDPRLVQLMIPDSGYSSNGVPLVRLTHIMPL